MTHKCFTEPFVSWWLLGKRLYKLYNHFEVAHHSQLSAEYSLRALPATWGGGTGFFQSNLVKPCVHRKPSEEEILQQNCALCLWFFETKQNLSSLKAWNKIFVHTIHLRTSWSMEWMKGWIIFIQDWTLNHLAGAFKGLLQPGAWLLGRDRTGSSESTVFQKNVCKSLALILLGTGKT